MLQSLKEMSPPLGIRLDLCFLFLNLFSVAVIYILPLKTIGQRVKRQEKLITANIEREKQMAFFEDQDIFKVKTFHALWQPVNHNEGLLGNGKKSLFWGCI